MITKTVKTFWADVYMAGDLGEARNALRKYTLDVGLCVTLTATEYVYTGGLEDGIKVGLINYPRFPKDPLEIRDTALNLARHLRTKLCQHSFCVVMPDETIWESLRDQ